MRLRNDSFIGLQTLSQIRIRSISLPAIRGISALLFILFCNVCSGSGQTSASSLTLDRCIELARGAPSAVKRARQQLQASKLGVRGARANFLPQISIANTFTYNSPLLETGPLITNRGGSSFVALNGIREYSTLGTTTLEVDSSGRLRALLDRARADEEIAQANLALSDRDLGRAVAVSYYHLLLARHLAVSAHTNLDIARDFEQRVQKLVAGEEASRADQSKALLEAALMERTAQASDLEAEMANHDLASFWTTDVTQPLTLAEDLDSQPSPPANIAVVDPYLHRPEFQLLGAQAAGFLADSRQARARMLPQLNLTFQYGIDSLRVASGDRGYAGFVNLDIPVFDWLRARSEQRQFQLQAQQVDTDRAIVTRLFSREYQDALASVNSSYAQTVTTERQVNLAKENLRLSQLRFQGGEGTALDVVTSQSALMQAQINYYSSRADYLNAQSALKVASAR